MLQTIQKVDHMSIGAQLGLESGDSIVRINGNEIDDALDFYFYTADDCFSMEILTKQQTTVILNVCKSDFKTDSLGLHFEDEFMGQYRHCQNHCLFCFIDQMPKGMRQSLYFKDDDARLSFLNGNYITMTNMSDKEFNKIIEYHLSPINVSVHATNPELRVKLLQNPHAGDVMDKMRTLAKAGITMNAQIVLCKGLNDGEELQRSIEDLSTLMPHLQSVSIVPVGLSRYRDHLYPLEPFTPEDAKELIQLIGLYQKRFYAESGLHFVHLADEFYTLCLEQESVDLPEADTYDEYLQIENGVGMLRSFTDEAKEALFKADKPRFFFGPTEVKVTVATAPCAYPWIEKLCQTIQEFADDRIRIHPVRLINRFFGEKITVTGLLTGQDVLSQLTELKEQGKLGDIIYLPANMLRETTSSQKNGPGFSYIKQAGHHDAHRDDVFLDDMTLGELRDSLQKPIIVVKSSGADFVKALMKAPYYLRHFKR